MPENFNPVHRRGLFSRSAFGRLAAVVALVFLAGCSSPPPTAQNDFAEENPEGGFLLKGLRVRVFEGSDLHYFLKAKGATVHTNGEKIDMDSVAAEVYSTGTVTTTISGDKGVLYLQDDLKRDIVRNDFALEGNIRFFNDITSVTVPSIHYHSSDPEIPGGKPEVSIVSGGNFCKMIFQSSTGPIDIQAKRFETNLTKFKFYGPGAITNTPEDPSNSNPGKNK